MAVVAESARWRHHGGQNGFVDDALSLKGAVTCR
jgi:hypothetical protein